MAGVIDHYVASLRRELDFDPALARRLASEVEDHLRDAAEADPAWPSPDAERRAVERFGVAREIAAQFAADAVDRQARRTWVTLLVTVAVTFVAMRLRVMWLDDGALPALAPLVDRYAFIAAIAVGAVGWFAFRRSLLAFTICLGGLDGLDRRRHRARRPLCPGRAVAGAAGGGRRDRVGRLAGVPCHRVRPTPQAHGGVAGRRSMNGWRLVGLLSLLLAAMSLWLLATTRDVEGIRLVIRATARTSLVLFVMAFTASALVELIPSRRHALAAPQPALSRRVLRRVAFHPSRRDPGTRRPGQ